MEVRLVLVTFLGLVLTDLGTCISTKRDGVNDFDHIVSGSISTEPVLIVISFDGFRYDYFKRINATNLDLLKKTGVSVPYMRNQFITKTSPNHQSIATGLYVESHGVIDNEVYDPKFKKNLTDYDGAEELWNYRDDVLPLWTLNQEAGGHRRSGTMMWPGSNVPYGRDKTLPAKYQSWNDTVPYVNRVDAVMNWLTNPNEPINLVFLYFEEPDEIAHGFGPDSPEVTAQIEKLDNITGYLVGRLKEAKIFDQVNLMFLSDHGFYGVKQENVINISSVVDPGLYHRYGSSPNMLIDPINASDVEHIYKAFKDHSDLNKHYSVYRKSELLPEWHYQASRRVAPIILLADIGYVFDDFYSYMQHLNSKFNLTADASRVYGAHGYSNTELPMHPFFIAHGPAFKRGLVAEPFENVDLFPLMCRILGLNEPPNNGSIKNVPFLVTSGGFNLRNPVGWVLGAAVVLGLVILAGIVSLMITRRKNKDLPFGVLENGYRYVSKSELVEIMEDEDSNCHLERENFPSGSRRFSDVSPGSERRSFEASTSRARDQEDKRSTGDLFNAGNSDEIQSLLMSSSNEEL